MICERQPRARAKRKAGVHGGETRWRLGHAEAEDAAKRALEETDGMKRLIKLKLEETLDSQDLANFDVGTLREKTSLENNSLHGNYLCFSFSVTSIFCK